MEVILYSIIYLMFSEFITGCFLWALFLVFREQWEKSPEHLSKGRSLIRNA